MTPQPVAFDGKHAAVYNDRWAKIAPFRDALHLAIRLRLSDLPANARILCVGAGTGVELFYLAEQFHGWHFTAVEPAPAMLAICRERTGAAGIAARCDFHEGYLDTLPIAEPFDAATSLLVSQFCLGDGERQNFFRQIADRLRPGGFLISADISGDTSGENYERLWEVWLQMHRFTGATTEDTERMREMVSKSVAIVPPSEVEAILMASGFDTPTLFMQTLLIHAWFAKRWI
ncbi:MAG: class I SAM-dependent methyltransferase [Armatimonadetes bacterium]|nr:class I SAM-dependent methyltransferase [Armatimonadota bacterium]